MVTEFTPHVVLVMSIKEYDQKKVLLGEGVILALPSIELILTLHQMLIMMKNTSSTKFQVYTLCLWPRLVDCYGQK